VENSIEDRVELNDLNKCRKEMLQALADFKEHSRTLSDLSVQEDKVHFANVRFIKNQVIDLADKFDSMAQEQSKQSFMISYLVNTIQKLEREQQRDASIFVPKT
jgi:hypothetical protein